MVKSMTKIFMALAGVVMIAVAVVLLCIFLPMDRSFLIKSIGVKCDGVSVSGKVTKVIGSADFRLSAVVNGGNVDFSKLDEPEITWSIEGASLNCSIDNNGLFKLGDTFGDVIVKITASSKNELAVSIVVSIVSVLHSITITSPQVKTDYIEGESFDPSGLEITAVFAHYSVVVTDYVIIAPQYFTPYDNGVIIRYTVNGVVKTVTTAVSVRGRMLQSIEVLIPPFITSYIEGGTFDPEGLLIVANYEKMWELTEDYQVDTTISLTPSITEVVVSYTENSITKTTTVPISVAPKTLQSLELISAPTIGVYTEGEVFNAGGLRVLARYEHLSLEVTGFVADQETQLTPANTSVIVSYTENGITKTLSVPVVVSPRTLQSISLGLANVKTSYIEGQTFVATNLVVTAHYEFLDQVVMGFVVDQSTKLIPSNTAWAVSYSEGGTTKTAEITILVAAKTLQSLSVGNLPNATSYIEGENFNCSGLDIIANYEYISQTVTGFSVDEATPLNPSNTLVLAYYTEGGVTKSVAIPVVVTPKTLQSIMLDASGVKISYVEGEAFNASGLVVTAYYEFLDQIVLGFTVDQTTKLIPSNTTWAVSYEERGIVKTDYLAISVAPKLLQSIEVTELPFTTAYIPGQIFSGMGMVVTAHYEYISLPITDYSVDIEGKVLEITDTLVTITYTEGVMKTASFALLMTDKVLASIAVQQMPTKQDYTVGEILSLVGLVVSGTYTDNENRIITGFSVDRVAPLELTHTLITITYVERIGAATVRVTTTFSVSITSRELVGIEITQNPIKIAYVEGENINLDGLEVRASFSDSTMLVITDYSVVQSGRVLGLSDTEIVINYTVAGQTLIAAVSITVAPRVLSDIEVDASTINTSYKTGERLNTAGLIVRAVYNNGALVKNITTYNIDIDGIALTVLHDKFIISYAENGVAKTFDVNIVVTARTLASVTISQNPSKLNYKAGEYVDLSGLVVMAHYADSTSVAILNFAFDKHDPLTVHDTQITISYIETAIIKTVSIAIVVTPDTITQNVRNLIDVIDALLAIEHITEANLAAVIMAESYAHGLIDSLMPAEKALVHNLSAFESFSALLAEIISELPGIQEPEFNITYQIYGGLVFEDVTFATNVTLYKNSDGEVALVAPTSAMAIEAGYQFVRFVDGDSLVSVTHIQNLQKDKVYYAVFELTSTVVLEFKDFSDKTTKLLEPLTITRKNASGTYMYNLASNNIVDEILAYSGSVAFAYYYVPYGETQSVLCQADELNVRLGACITIYVVAYELRRIVFENAFDASLSWMFNYIDDKGEMQSVFSKYPPRTEYFVPIGSRITLTAINPTIVDFVLDGVKQNLLYPARTIEFELSSDSAALEVVLEKTTSANTTIAFVGATSLVFVYASNFSGVLSLVDIAQVTFIFEEDSEFYFNVFITGTHILTFDELKAFVFDTNTVVTVERRERAVAGVIILTIELYDDVLIQTNLSLEAPDLLALLVPPDRDGFNFIGWSDTAGGALFDSQNFEQFILAAGSSATVFAVWEAIIKEPVDYSGQAFVGAWTVVASNEYGVISSQLTLFADGEFEFITYLNGVLNSDLFGSYVFEDGKIAIITLSTTAATLLIQVQDFSFDIGFCADNLLISKVFVLDNLTVSAYNYVLIKGAIKPLNPIENNLKGVYNYTQITAIGSDLQEESTDITIEANGRGTITHTIKHNNVVVLLQIEQGYVRVSSTGEVLFLSNGVFGTFDLSLILSASTKIAATITTPAGTWIAANVETLEDVAMLTLTNDGLITLSMQDKSVSVYVVSLDQGVYLALASLNGQTMLLQIEFISSNQLRINATAIESDEELNYLFMPLV